MIICGHFFDLYPVRNGMVVWILGDDGKPYHCFDPFHPAFYLRLGAHDQKRILPLAQRFRMPVTIGKERKTELFSGEEWEVAEITVHDPLQFTCCVRTLQKFFPHFAFYNSNIPVAQMYLYDRQVFPLARCQFNIDEENTLRNITVTDIFDAPNYLIPDLKIMRLHNTHFATKFSRTLNLEISYEEKTYALERHDPEEVLHSLNWHLYHYDPDIIISAWGDATLFPTLAAAATRCHIPLLLNRDQTQGFFHTKERSYWSYGEIIHRDGAFMLAGRWHMDAENSFIMGESDIEGVIERMMQKRMRQ